MSRYRDWALEQRLLLPPSVREFVPPGHLCLFVQRVVSEVLGLSAIERTCSRYRLRKQVVEPVLGQLQECRGFRRFQLRATCQARCGGA